MSNHVPWEARQGEHSSVASMRHSPPHRTRAVTNPPHPQALFPAHRPSTVHRSDIFFVTSAPIQNPTGSRNFPRIPTNNSTATPHVFHRSLTCPPPIPPKPDELLEAELPSRVTEEHSTDTREIPSEEDELAIVLALSQTESAKRQTMLEKLSSQEEEDLAHALAESLKTTSSVSGSTSPPGPSNTIPSIPEEPGNPQQSLLDITEKHMSNGVGLTPKNEGRGKINRPRTSGSISTQNLRLLIDPGVGRVSNPCANDEALARRLEEEERKASESRTAQDDRASPTSARQTSPYLVTDDEKYARQLVNEDAKVSSTRRPKSKSLAATVTSRISDLPPPYEPSPSLPATPAAINRSELPPIPNLARNVSAGVSSITQFEPSTSQPEGTSNHLSPPSNVGSPEQSHPSSPQPPHLITRSLSSVSLPSLCSSAELGYEDVSNQSNTVNPYVADELLNGVSIGFDPPVLSPQLSTWQKPLPSIISLPYNRSVPLHFQATCWRHILKLMARLPGTSIQATLDAMAVSKTEHKLRTVVQFVKPHLASNEWRTILWFTLEHPVPDDVTGRSRYTYDANVLPWSYTFSALPQLLRGGAESQLSKMYTIPACNSLPFPTVPITFPDLAMYLHTALEISRRHINDSSSGTRKLAKIIDTCYPGNNAEEADDPERRGVSGLIKKVIGRNNRRRGGNEDTYDLVTPFVASEWG